MSLFKDDFYSSKVSKRLHKRLGNRNRGHYSTGKAFWRRFAKSTIQIVALTSITTAIIVSIIFISFISARTPSTSSVVDLSERSISASSKVRPAVVSIVNEQKFSLGLNSKRLDDASTESGIFKDISAGSGVIISRDDKDALIVTNYHVVNAAQKIRVVLTSGEERYAEVVGKDKISDLAVLKISAEGITEVAEIGDSSQLQSAEFVLAVGNPLGMGESTTLGIISVKSEIIGVAIEQVGEIDWEQEVIRVDAAINQGNSGGPLIDMNGQVVGINSMKIADFGVESIGYAIPINNVMPIVDQLIEKGYVARPYIGIVMKNLSQYYEQLAMNKELQKMFNDEDLDIKIEDSEQTLKLPDQVLNGVIVLETSGPAKEAGLQFNDVIYQLDDVKVNEILDLRRYLYTKKQIGEELIIHFYRGNEKKTTTITLIEKNPDL